MFLLGYLPYTINTNNFFSYHMMETQTIDIVSIMFYLTSIALFGLDIGKKNKVASENTFIYWIIFIFTFFVATLLVIKRPLIFMNEYHTGIIDMPLGNLNTIANTLLFVLILYYFKFRNLLQIKSLYLIRLSLFFIVFYLLIYAELLRGSRMDFLNGIVVLYNIYVNGHIKISFRIILYGMIFFVVLQIRSVIAVNGLSEAINKTFNYFENFGVTGTSDIIIVQGTINNISSTFSGIVYLVKHKMIMGVVILIFY